jgi:aminoglycoside phosphotransferase (APT) family kinase protein
VTSTDLVPLRRERPSAEVRAWVGAALGGEVVATRRLKGGISAATRIVVVERSDGTTTKAVLRRFVNEGWLAAEPELATREAVVLEALEAHGVAAPRLLAVDGDGRASGSVCLLQTLEPGRPLHHVRPGYADELVAALLRVHEVPTIPGLRDQVARLDHDIHQARPRRFGFDVDARVWAEVARLWPTVERRPSTLVHDDYHPGNVLWHRGHLSSIVDWTTAAVGQPAADVCYLGLDVSLVLGLEHGDEVHAAHERLTGAPVPDRRFWDLFAAARAVGVVDQWWGSYVEFGRTDLTLATVEARLDAFVERALG